MAYVVNRRALAGLFLAAAAAPLAYRGWKSRIRANKVCESIRIERPLNEVIQSWRQRERLPRRLRSVNGHSVKFTSTRSGRSTQVLVRGRGPETRLREDLRQFKHILEAGEIPRTNRHPR
jgi:uncharacterized membrane protein